jgi:hypothetical protein
MIVNLLGKEKVFLGVEKSNEHVADRLLVGVAHQIIKNHRMGIDVCEDLLGLAGDEDLE